MKRALPLFLALTMVLVFTPAVSAKTAAPDLADSLPLADYPVGSYFTKNGKACTCHEKTDCIASGKYCNCMRFFPTGKYATCDIDLLGVQCIGFARYCQYRLYGFIDYGDTAYRYRNVLGKSLSAYKWTAADAKKYITEAGMGGHIRISTHSIIIMEVTDWGFVSYECNGQTPGSECRVFSRTFTWESFYSAYRDTTWHYLKVPKAAYLPEKAPETTAAPTTTAIPETTHAPETTVAPEATIAPETTVVPITTTAPETSLTPPQAPQTPTDTEITAEERPEIPDSPVIDAPIRTPDTSDTPIDSPPNRVSLAPYSSPVRLPTPPFLLPTRDDE